MKYVGSKYRIAKEILKIIDIQRLIMQSYCDLVNKVLNDGSFRKEPNKNSDILSYFGYLFGFKKVLKTEII